MKARAKGWVTSSFGQLSTGLKMLLFLTLGLLPLGVLAILASIDNARQKNAERTRQTLTRLEVKAQRLDEVLSRSAITITTANAAISLTPQNRVCETTLRRLRQGPVPGLYALYGSDGALRCASSGFAPPAHPNQADGPGIQVRILPERDALEQFVFGEEGNLEGVVEFSRETLASLSYIPGTSGNFDLDLIQGGRKLVLRDQFRGGPLVRTVGGSESVADGQLSLQIRLGATPISAADALMTLLPVLMWLFAALIGWVIADRLLLRPLARMQRAVSAYKPGDRHLDLPAVASPAREITELGEAFDQVTQTVARHEAELEAAIERQSRLVREVHHRVKNNLQVVASLLNLHSRGSSNEEVAAAYASIQRRVDALAVVHRNHYAELEENRGVALKALISELGANLRATAPLSASHMPITLNLESVYVTQDVAVSVAFLITEMVEFAMFCGAEIVAVSLTTSSPGTATLAVHSDSLQGDRSCDEELFGRFDRIITGLARQLRSAMVRDLETGLYSVDITISDKDD
ncbi:sensor histidine kinase [Sphingosinicella rhizophila]|uniref:histidine kinase n=1 Tax=Sphingosinicella rhizophila TaxID=3050082 RepID=A0ABU3Q523_9SPHN|nr:sensor histidine kinase [Sphingosinicella sp. GR2756]MDT9598063.1 sensor histidine kinase [Sphingosinicella sp. GR2756]